MKLVTKSNNKHNSCLSRKNQSIDVSSCNSKHINMNVFFFALERVRETCVRRGCAELTEPNPLNGPRGESFFSRCYFKPRPESCSTVRRRICPVNKKKIKAQNTMYVFSTLKIGNRLSQTLF